MKSSFGHSVIHCSIIQTGTHKEKQWSSPPISFPPSSLQSHSLDVTSKLLYLCSHHFHKQHHHHTSVTTTVLSELAMEAKSFEGKHNFKDKAYKEAMVDDDFDYETEEEEVGGGGPGGSNGCTTLGCSENEKKKRGTAVPGRGRSGGGVSSPSCQAHNCATDLSEAKRYHRRHKVCEFHSKAAVVMVAGNRQRFCQQCSRFHELSEFDEAKRSCRRRLAGHNERRRKSSAECQGESTSRKGSTPQSKESQCRQLVEDQRRKIRMAPTGSSSYKHLPIR